ncbi:MAG: alpha/beta hydrolase [Desulfobacterium sp.]|nr:alpha/beta hydrolase [Desulfobacterium sp.]
MDKRGFDIDWFYGTHGHRLRFGRLDSSKSLKFPDGQEIMDETSHGTASIQNNGQGFSLEKAKKVILLLNGRSEFLEKYEEVALELSSRGYLVLSFDWRGQGLSVRELENRQKGYVKTFDDYLGDLDVFYREIVKPLSLPVTVLAHSMGGHLALRLMHDNPSFVDRAVLVSPMIDIVTSPFPTLVARKVANIACAAGFGESYVFGSSNYVPGKEPFENNRLTHDREQFYNVEKLIAANPDLALGDVTYAWLKATFDSIDLLNSKQYARDIGTRVLLISAGQDRVVSVNAHRRMAKILPDCEFVSIPHARHEILHETREVRDLFWNYFDSFTSQGSKGR